MKSLIYATVSRTPIYRQMLCLMVRSLRAAGKYSGDIYIMCNLIDEHLIPIQDLVTFRLVNPQCGVKDERMEGLAYIDPTGYDVILNLDCDIMVLRDIAPVLDCIQELRYFDEPWGYLGKPCTMYTYYFTPEEALRYAWCHTINVGHFAVSGQLMWPLYRAWKRTLLSKTHETIAGSDQAAFNALIRRGLLPSRPFDRGIICNASQTPKEDWRDAAVIHFAGYGNERLEMMRGLQ